MTQWILDRLVALEQRVADLEKLQTKDVKPVKARRMADGWQPRPEDVAWAAEKYGEVDAVKEQERFTDYWISKGEARSDWNAAYRNWIRKAADIGATSSPQRTRRPEGRAAAIAADNRAKRDRFLDELDQVRRDPD